MSRKSSSIAVIGVSAMFPDASNLKEYWQNIVKGHDAIRPIPVSHWKPEELYDADPKRPDFTYAKTGGFLKPYDFDPLKFGIAPTALEATDTTQLLGMVCAHEALLDAGYGPSREFNKERVSCIIGVTGTLELVIPLGARLSHPAWKRALKNAGVSDTVAAEVMDEISSSFVPWQENSFPGLLGNVVAGRIASRFDLGGSNAVVDAACASSLAALSMAVMELESGRADMVISGGMDTFNDIFMYMCFSKTPALSPTGHSRPFDADGDGTAIGEGLGAVILKRLEDAERDGDRIYALIKGVGSGSDGKGQAIYAPAAKGQVKALSRAYESADISPTTVELLEAHGTGTRVGDGVEISALAQIYPPSEIKHCVIGSVKSQIGHTKAAAGAAGLIKAVMALQHKVQPPTLKVRTMHAGLANTPFQVLDEARPWIPRGDYPRRAAVSAFGFGGSNFHCVVEEYRADDKPVAWDDEHYFFAYSGASREQILEKMPKLSDSASAQILARQSRSAFAATDTLRLTLWASSFAELKERWERVSEALLKGTTVPGVVFAEGPAKTDLTLIFAGQGSQSIGMLRELMLMFPESLPPLEMASKILREEEGGSLSLMDYIYPSQAFGDERKGQQKALTATRIAQLALGGVGAALILILKRFGVKATQVAGHSYGELLALYAAGSMKLEDMLQASYRRGFLMEKAGKERGGAGMLAVMASSARVSEVLVETGSSAAIANYNSSEQVVVGGALSELESLKAELKKRGIGQKALDVSTAFHTEFVAGASQEFLEWLKANVEFLAPEVPVFGNKHASEYSLAQMAETLSAQLASPVKFEDMLKAMGASESNIVEVGPGRKILGLLKAANSEALSLDSGKNSVLGLLHLLADLTARGVPVALDAWHPGEMNLPPEQKKAFTVSLTGANYRAEKPKKLAPSVRQQALSEASPRDIASAEALASSSRIISEVKTGTAHVPENKTGFARAEEKPRATAALSTPMHAVGKSETRNTQEASMSKNDQSSGVESILREMQEAQRRTTDAHMLFLENQRSFQALLRSALLGDSTVAAPQTLAWTPAPAPAPVAAASAPAPSPSPVPATFSRPPVAVTPEASSSARVAEPVQVSAVAPVSTPPANKSSDEAVVYRIISEATGFPIEMLNPELHLETDLGIDSIKKVEIFSQVQAKNPSLKAEAHHMNEAETIAHLIALLNSSEATNPPPRQGATLAGAVTAGAVSKPSAKAAGDARHVVLAVISDKTGFPVEMLEDGMDLEADLGVDSIKKVEIFSAISEKFPEVPFANDAINELHHIHEIVARLSGGSGSSSASPAPSMVDNKAILWQVIEEKTGYPSDVLTLAMDLEGDLGIDSIKRVEILSALTERKPELRDNPVQEVRTLADLLELLDGESHSAVLDEEGLAESLLHPESSDWDLSAKKKSTDDEARIQSADELSYFEQGIGEKLKAAHVGAYKLRAVPWAESQAYARELKGEIWVLDDGSARAMSLLIQAEDRGVKAKLVSLSSIDKLVIHDDLSGLILLCPKVLGQDPIAWYANVYKLLQKVGPTLQANQGFVATVSRLGGEFGLDNIAELEDVYKGGISAIAKTLSHEWPEVHARAIDLGRDFNDNSECAHRCLDAILLSGPLEIGVFKNRFITLKLEPSEFVEGSHERILVPSDTVLVTGGARGVTAATLKHLAKRYPVRFVIWGRTALPSEEAIELRHLVEAGEIKRTLMKLHPEYKHPREIEKAFNSLLSSRELRSTLEDLKTLGAEVIYEAVDVSDEAGLRANVQHLIGRYGMIRGVIHGAGVLRDKFVLDQTEEELNSVLATKLRILPYLQQFSDLGASWMVLFSSSTARLGRTGQGAYCLANEILNRTASYISSTSNTRVLSLNWGPWDGGMVHDGLKKLFASEGLGTIGIPAGAALQTFLLEHPEYGSGEWTVLGKGGEEILKDHLITGESVLARRTVSVAEVPVLIDHVIKNHAVVPAALLLEWMAAAAKPYFPGQRLHEATGFQVYKGLVLDGILEIEIEIVATEQSSSSIDCVLRSKGTRPDMIRPHAKVHFEFLPEFPKTSQKIQPYSVDKSLDAFEPYAKSLFHGESLHLIQTIKHCDSHRLVAELELMGEAKDWYEAGKEWNAQAPLLDAVFQAAIVWADLTQASRCLPAKFEEARFYQAWRPQLATLDLHLTLINEHQLKASAKVFAKDGSLIAEVIGFEATLDASLVDLFAQRTLCMDLSESRESLLSEGAAE